MTNEPRLGFKNIVVFPPPCPLGQGKGLEKG